MQARFRSQVVDIRPGEIRLFLQIFFVLVLTIAGHTLLETARDVLFLSKLAPRMLAFVYVTVALSMVLMSPLNVRLTRVSGPRNALIVGLLLTALGASWFRLRVASESSVFGLYVFGTVSATLVVGQVWLLAGTLFTPAQSRRLLGPLAAGGVLGAVIGAGVAALLLRFTNNLRALLGLATLAYFGAAWIASTINAASLPASQAGPLAQLGPELGKLRRDPLLSRLALVAALSASIAVLVDFLFKAKVSHSLAPERLGPFFALYQLFVNLTSLFLQVAVAGPLVQRVGVVGLALLAPLLLAAGAGATALSGAAFASVVALKGLDTALRNSIGRVANELLWAPVENQSRGRGVVDLVITRGVQALAGGALLAATMRHELPPPLLAGAAALLAGLWLVAGVRIRIPYISVFRTALKRGSVEREFKLGELDLTSVETLVEALARPNAGEVIAAINVLAERGRGKLIPALILYHDDPQVLVRALEVFATRDRKDWFPLGERLVEHAVLHVRQAAVRAFALAGESAVLERLKQHADPSVRTFAVVYLSQLDGIPLPGDPLSWELFEEDDAHHTLKRAFIEGIAAHPGEDTTRILLALGNLSALQGDVVRALHNVGDASSIEFLCSCLKFADDRMIARRALVRLGEPALRALKQALDDTSTDRRIRVHVPRSISAFANTQAVAILLTNLTDEKDGLVRYKTLRGLEQIARDTLLPIDPRVIVREITRNALEYLRLFALRFAISRDPITHGKPEIVPVDELLDDKLLQSKERLARLLQIVHRGDDVPAIFAALDSRDRHVRGRAVEFLDALIRGFGRESDDVATTLRLVVDDLGAQQRVARSVVLLGSFVGAHAALAQLSNDSDPVVRELVRRAESSLLPSHASLNAEAIGLEEQIA